VVLTCFVVLCGEFWNIIVVVWCMLQLRVIVVVIVFIIIIILVVGILCVFELIILSPAIGLENYIVDFIQNISSEFLLILLLETVLFTNFFGDGVWLVVFIDFESCRLAFS